MAKPDLGTKRQCQSCGARFYDLGRDPITCPKCHAIYQLAAPKARPVADEEEEAVEVDEVAAVETVSLEDVEAEEAGPAKAKTDVDIDDDEIADDEDDTFLEDEEEEDDVTGLIDGEIENDEES